MKNKFHAPLMSLFFIGSLFFVGGTEVRGGSESLSLFQKANEAYQGGDYAKAASFYESLITQGWKNPTVFYNLGNAYFKEKQLGRAILSYEKAKQLAPRDRDISANLAYVRGLLEYRMEDKRNSFTKGVETFLNSFTLEEIRIGSLTVGLVFWLAWIFPLYFGSDTWSWRRKLLVGLALGCVSLWVLKGIHAATVQEAVVLKDQAVVRYGPSHKDQVAFRLGEGMKVRLHKKAGEWGRITLINGETGWIFREELGEI